MHRQAEPARSNLLFAALGPTRRVIMGDTLLDGFTADEIEVVFAHEIGHHVYRHIYKLIAVGVLLSAAGFWLCDQILRSSAGIGEPVVARSPDRAAGPVLARSPDRDTATGDLRSG